jgi:hypothetical protein
MDLTLKQTISKKVWFILGAIVLFVLPLWRINIGVDITDVGYSLGNFENFTSMEGMWVIATYLANLVGHLFTLLPFGHTMMGMNFYTGLVVSIILVFSYMFLSKIMPSWIVFIGEVLAFSLCWCPTAILYNYLTYFFMTLALYFLFKGIMNEKTVYLVLAGVVLGVNVFARFPNLVEMGFILVLWYDAIVQKKGWKTGIFDTLKCIVGYIIGFGTVFVIVLVQYGWQQYVGMLQSLSNVGSNVTGYGPLHMIKVVVDEYFKHLSWIWMAVICIIIVQFIYTKISSRFWKGLVCVLGGGVFAGIFLHYYRSGLFAKTGYNSYHAIFFWAMLFLVMSLGVDVYLLLKKEEKREIKLLAMISIMIIAITPLGSNNSVYPNFNNLFLVAPLTFYGVYRYILQKKFRKSHLPLQVAVAAVLLITLVQCFMFKTIFTFRDAGLTGVDTVITENEVLKGMKTTEFRASLIESATAYINSEGLENREVVVFGYVPAMAYYLGLEPGISSMWPDLPSYSVDEFACSLRQAENPIVLIDSGAYPDIMLMDGIEENEKASLVATYLREYDYSMIYDYGFQIYDTK